MDKPYGDTPPEVPSVDVNYHRDFMDQGWRKGLKPLTVLQPEGASFLVSSAAAIWLAGCTSGAFFLEM